MGGRLNSNQFLKGLWSFQAHAQDTSGYGNHGTWTASTEAYADGPRGVSVAATGGAGTDITAGILVGDIAELELQTFSVFMRFKADTLSNFRTLASSVASAVLDEGWVLFYDSSALKFRVAQSGQQATIAFTDTSVWHDLVITCDGTTLRIYLDTVEGTSDTFTAPVDYTDASLVLGGLWGGAAISGAHKGKISEVRIYNIVLTQEEVSELSRTGVPRQKAVQQPIPQVPDLSDGNLLLSALNKRTSGAEDLSSNNNDGTPTDVVFGPVGAKFNGSTSKIDFGAVGSVVEISMLVKPAATSESILQVDGATDDIILSSGTVTYGAGLTASATFVDAVASTTLVARKWQHLVCQISAKAGDNFELGWDGVSYGDMEVRDLRVSTMARTIAQITQEVRKGVPDADVKLHTFVTDARDLSVKGNDGIVYGEVVLGNGAVFDGVDSIIDFSSPGFIQEVESWINPVTDTEFLFLLATMVNLRVVSGTITYTDLNEIATYVNGVATTALKTGIWQHIVCQFSRRNAPSFVVGNDRSTEYGAFSVKALWVRDRVMSADEVLIRYLQQRKYY